MLNTISWRDACERMLSFEQMALRAIQVRHKAYAPRSGFQVGSVVVTGAGYWYAGCNVENAFYVVTHAEQAAIAAMIAEFGGDPKPVIETVIVAALSGEKDQHVLSCGFCLQWIAEFGTPQTKIYGVRLAGEGDEVSGVDCASLGELLPYAFTL